MTALKIGKPDLRDIDQADREWLAATKVFQDIEWQLDKPLGRQALGALIVRRRGAQIAREEKQNVSYILRERMKKDGLTPPPWPAIPKGAFDNETSSHKRNRRLLYRQILDELGVPKGEIPKSIAHRI